MEIIHDNFSMDFCLTPTMLRSKAEKTWEMWAVNQVRRDATVCDAELSLHVYVWMFDRCDVSSSEYTVYVRVRSQYVFGVVRYSWEHYSFHDLEFGIFIEFLYFFLFTWS